MKTLLAGILTAFLISSATSALADENKPTIYIASDSTAQTYKQSIYYPEIGWGQVFGDLFTDEVVVDNRATGGRSTKRYYDEGRLDKILEVIKPGDYLFVQFGINDGDTRKEDRYISVEDYKKLLKEEYIGEVQKRGAIPILLTASASASWDEENGQFSYSRTKYANATREVAQETGCRMIDINKVMTDTYNTMDKDEVLSGYLICEPLESAQNPAGTDDRTHFKEKGARRVASLIAEQIPVCVPELAQYLKGDESFTDISGHRYEADIRNALENGLINCSGDCKFDPDREVTRGEFLKMAMDAAGIPGHGLRAGECLEATADDPYCYCLQGALDKGLIPLEMTGVVIEPKLMQLSEATEEKEAVTKKIMSYRCGFKSDIPITGEEMAVIAMNCLSYAADNRNKELAFVTDKIDISNSGIPIAYLNKVRQAFFYGLINESESGSFSPKGSVTRAQAIAVANRMAELLR